MNNIPIPSTTVPVLITSWTPAGTYPDGKPCYKAIATMQPANPPGPVVVSDDGTNLSIAAPFGQVVQINFEAMFAEGATIADGSTNVTVVGPYLYTISGAPAVQSWAQFANCIIGHTPGIFGPNLTWDYAGGPYTIAPVPPTGVAIFDLNNVSAGVNFSYGFMFQSNLGNFGTWDPSGTNDPTQPS